MRRFLSVVCLASLITAGGCAQRTARELQPNQTAPVTTSASPCALPVPTGYVSDFANVLDQTARAELERKLENLNRQGNIDFALAFVEETAGREIFDYSLDLARCWGIGTRNPDGAGVLLLVAVKDRKWHIQITTALEKVLTNADVYEIGDKMIPDFKQGQFAAGVNKSVDAMINTLATRRGFSVVIREGSDRE